MMLDSLPPHDDKAEEATLGALILGGDEAMGEVRHVLEPQDFYRQQHATLYAAMQAVYSGPVPLDPTVLTAHLEASGVLETIGGYPFLHTLLDAVWYSGHAKHYAGIVRKLSIRRQAIRAAAKLAESAHSGEQDVAAVLDDAERTLFTLRQGATGQEERTLGQAIGAFLDEAMHEERSEPVRTGFYALDALIGGLYPGQLCVLAGKTSQGKTALALQIAVTLVKAKRGVLDVSEEMSAELVAGRILGAESRVPMVLMRRWAELGADRQDAVMQAAGKLGDLPLVIEDRIVDVLGVRAAAKRVQMRYGLALIVVDYLQLVTPHTKTRGASRAQEVGDIARGLKNLATEMRVPVLALSQYNRDIGDQEPELYNLRESGDIENAADVALLMWRPDSSNQAITEVKVAKNRNGPLGRTRLYFEGPTTSFRLLEERR